MTDTAPVDPRRTALLVMDYQNGIVGMVDGVAEPLARAAEAIALVRSRGGTVGHVRVGFTEEDHAAMPETSAMAASVTPERRAAMHPDAPGTAFHEQVSPAAEDIVVRKTRVGAFSTTDLHDQLRAAGVDTLILAGLSTSGVVLSTVRDAADRDYRVIVLSDACADPQPGVHDFLVQQIFPRQAHVVATAELPALLS